MLIIPRACVCACVCVYVGGRKEPPASRLGHVVHSRYIPIERGPASLLLSTRSDRQGHVVRARSNPVQLPPYPPPQFSNRDLRSSPFAPLPSPLRTYNSNFPIRTLLPFPFLSLDSFDSGQDPGQRSKEGKWSNFRVLGSLPLPWNNFFNRKKGKGGSLESVGISR